VLVTQPIENSLNGVPGLLTLRSASIQGLSLITVTFDPSTDVYRDRQTVAERLTALVGQFPSGVGSPVMTPLTSSTSLVLVAVLIGRWTTRLKRFEPVAPPTISAPPDFCASRNCVLRAARTYTLARGRKLAVLEHALT